MNVQSLSERFWAKVNKTDSCWLWTGATAGSRDRYGVFRPGSSRTTKAVYAHRYAYEMLVGPIPDGLEIDHVTARGCVSKLCVNPAHLEPVTKMENLRRRWTVDKTHCKRNHEFTEENTYMDPKGVRYCKICRRARDKARR